MAKPNVAELVEQMPETDRDIQAKQKAAQDAAAQPQPDNKEAKKPAPKLGEASKFTGPDPDKAYKIYETIIDGGQESVLELLALIHEPSESEYKNYKAAYVLHGLVVLAGRAGQEQRRKLLAETLAAEIGKDKYSKAVRGYFIRELQLVGGQEAIKAIAAQLKDEEMCETATQALLAIREGVSEHLQRALGQVSGRNRVTITQALGVLKDTAATGELRKALGDQERDVRIAAAWGLCNMGVADAADAVLKLSDGAENWERIQTTKACLLLAEKLIASGNKAGAEKIYRHLRDKRSDKSETFIRMITEKALGGPVS